MSTIENEKKETQAHCIDEKQPPTVSSKRLQWRESFWLNLKEERNSVSLKEHLLALREADREATARDRALVVLRFDLAQRALELDHAEMLRRLDVLNHSHENARQKEATFVSRDVYESQTKDHYKWRDEVNVALSTRQGKLSVIYGLAGAVGGFALTALFGLIMYITKAALNGMPK